jgi:hypothetical protein
MSKTINVSDETYEKIKSQLLAEETLDISKLEDLIGKSFYFRTVTYHQVGRVVKIIGNLIQLEEASWVADSGRFMDAIKNGTLDEVEPVGTFFININALSDMCPWNHTLPKEQK